MSSLSRFLRHYVEMVVAMFLGMAVLRLTRQQVAA
jgi:hypothetical protein